MNDHDVGIQVKVNYCASNFEKILGYTLEYVYGINFLVGLSKNYPKGPRGGPKNIAKKWSK